VVKDRLRITGMSRRDSRSTGKWGEPMHRDAEDEPKRSPPRPLREEREQERSLARGCVRGAGRLALLAVFSGALIGIGANFETIKGGVGDKYNKWCPDFSFCPEDKVDKVSPNEAPEPIVSSAKFDVPGTTDLVKEVATFRPLTAEEQGVTIAEGSGDIGIGIAIEDVDTEKLTQLGGGINETGKPFITIGDAGETRLLTVVDLFPQPSDCVGDLTRFLNTVQAHAEYVVSGSPDVSAEDVRAREVFYEAEADFDGSGNDPNTPDIKVFYLDPNETDPQKSVKIITTCAQGGTEG